MTKRLRPSFRRAATACAAALVLSVPAVCEAASGDGAYGRLDGDLDLSIGVGGGTIVSPQRSVGLVDVRARYFESAGVVLQYEEADAFSRAVDVGDYRRGFLAAVELRPLFPVRFLKNREWGSAFPDLLLDSIGLELGAWFHSVEGTANGAPGLHLGLGVEVPLAARATGLWLRVGAATRWTASRLEGEHAPGSRVALLTLGLAWHQMVGAHVVDMGDRLGE
jgi:hypothetical protein